MSLYLVILMSWQYLSVFPVCLSMMAPMKQGESCQGHMSGPQCLSGLQVAVMKFVGFGVKGEIWHEVVSDYHIDEMGFCSDPQLSSSPQAFDNRWCIVIVVDDGGLPVCTAGIG
jgi:hypothetical protein